MGKINHGPGFAGNYAHAQRRFAFSKPTDRRKGKCKGWFPGAVTRTRFRVRASAAKPRDPVTGKRPYKKRMTRQEQWELFCQNLGIEP